MQTINVDSLSIPVLADSEVFQQGQGYERAIIVSEWNPHDLKHMALLHMRVDRNPMDSFARASVWTVNSGWQPLVHIAPNDFWHSMPGYLRWSNDDSDSKTQGLAARLIASLTTLANNEKVVI